jgi:hypothetical protein
MVLVCVGVFFGGGCQPFVCRGVEVAGLAFLWMAFLVAGVVGVSLWRLGALCVSCSFGGLVVLLAVVFGFRATSYCVWGVLLMW